MSSPSAPPSDPAALPHDSVQANTIGCAVATWLIAVVFVALRIYSRRFLANVMALSDWLILAALVLATATTVSSIQQIVYGLGRHVWDVDLALFSPLLRAQWYSILFYALTQFTVKLSILSLFAAIFTLGWIRWAIWIVLAVTVVSNIFIIVTVSTACVPLQAYWDPTVSGHCHPQSIFMANTGLHITTDFLIYVLPIPVVSKLNLPKYQKISLIATFALGFFACFTSLIRLIFFLELVNSPSPDWTYAGGGPFEYWTAIEICMGIIVACLMTFKPLMILWFPKLFPASDQSSSTANRVPTIGVKSSRGASSGGRCSDEYPGRLGPVSRQGSEEDVFHELETRASVKDHV